MDNVKLSVASWNRFLTTNFFIVPELVGSMHEFVYKMHSVKISLPSKQQIPKETFEGDLLSFNTYREIDGEKKPIQFSVHAVDITVQIPDQIHIPQEVLNRPPNAYDILSDSKQAQLNQLALTYTGIAEEAFGFWIRVLRWKSDNSEIGRPQIIGHKSGWGTYLLAKETSNRVWAWHDTFRVPREPAITSEIWENTSSVLQKGIDPPIYIELMFDGIEHAKAGDFRRAIIDMAVACEVYLRTLVSRSLPSGLNNAIMEYIDDANIRPVLTKFIPEILNGEGKKSLKKLTSPLHSLFDIRNKIVHTAKQIEITQDECQKYLAVTRELFLIEPITITDSPSTAG